MCGPVKSLYAVPVTQTPVKHRMRWFVYAGGYGQPLERIPHTATMRGHWPGWDAECTCGQWKSRTGGGVRTWVERLANEHKRQAAEVDAIRAVLAEHLPAAIAADVEHGTGEGTATVSARPGSGLTDEQLRATLDATPGVYVFHTLAYYGKPPAYLLATEV